MCLHMKVNAGLSQAGTSSLHRQRCSWLLMLLRYDLLYKDVLFFSACVGLLALWSRPNHALCSCSNPNIGFLRLLLASTYIYYAAAVCHKQELQHNSILASSRLQLSATPHAVLLAGEAGSLLQHALQMRSADAILIHLQQSQQQIACFVALTRADNSMHLLTHADILNRNLTDFGR